MNYEELKEKRKKINDRVTELVLKRNKIDNTPLQDLNLSKGDIDEIINIMDEEWPYMIEGARVEDFEVEYKNGEFVFNMDYEKAECELGHLHSVKNGVFAIDTFKELDLLKSNPDKQIGYRLEGFIDEDECEYCQEDEEGEW